MSLSPVPYGAWPTPLSAARVARVGAAVGEVRFDSAGQLCWAEGRPAEGGRVAVVRLGWNGEVEELVPPDFNARTRVHEYGGRAWLPVGEGVVAARWDDQRLWLVEAPGARPRPLTPDSGGEVRYADPCHQAGAAIWVQEDTRGGDVRRALVRIPLEGDVNGSDVTVEELVAGPRFLSTPRVSPDNRMLSWLAWEHPQMPWDGTELWIARLGARGITGAQRVAGCETESLFQPTWTPDGHLYVMSDRTGWWNLYEVDLDGVGSTGALVPLFSIEEECGWPQWRFGQGSFVPLSDGRVAVVHGRETYNLDVLNPSTGELQPLGLPFTAYRPVLDASGRTVAAVAASPTAPYAVVTVDTTTGTHSVARTLGTTPDPAYLSRPRSVIVPSARGRHTHAHVYPPTNPNVTGPAGERPPYLLFVHGGPTGQSLAAYDPQIAFFTSRGIGVADVNYGGSTGYGRVYRELLRGEWGVVDVDDCVAVARWLVAQGLTAADRVLIRGGSAGGFTVLAAMTSAHCFAAGTSFYGIPDPRAFAEDTHDFESRYLDGLIGSLPEAAQVYADRAPLSRVDRMSCPVLLLHGREDKVVSPAQAEVFATALRRRQVPFALVVFPREQHGFRRAETLTRALEAELSFYGQVLGFDPPGVPPLELERVT
jgi:dipeptidyl aminopeptidase/acylaminoacyl peptidase